MNLEGINESSDEVEESQRQVIEYFMEATVDLLLFFHYF